MNPKNPKISVIIPVYKAEKSIHKCLDSLLKQTFRNFEVLLIDDGSPDGSGEICDKYANTYSFIHVIHQPNGGVSKARNVGIQYANGEWITFIDSDDYVEATFLNDFHIKENSDIDIYLQGYKIERNDLILCQHNFSVNEFSVIPFEQLFVEGESQCILNSPCCKLFSNNYIKSSDLKFDMNISYGEDHLFVLFYLCYVRKMAVSSAASYKYVYYDNESLSKRIVPCEELIYYTKSCYEIQQKLLRTNGIWNKKCISIVNTRSYSNLMRIIADTIIAGKLGKIEYCEIKKVSATILTYEGLKLRQKCLLFFLKRIPFVFSFIMFRLWISIKDIRKRTII